MTRDELIKTLELGDPEQVMSQIAAGRDEALQFIKEKYHRLADQHHPDKGGDVEKFKMVSKAYHLLRASIMNRNYLCEGCGGNGFILICSGFNSIKQKCRWCRGTGKQQ